MAELEVKKFSFKVGAAERGLRLDQYIIKNLKSQANARDISRSRIQRLIKDGKIVVNRERSQAHYKVKKNDAVLVSIPESSPLRVLAEDIPLDIVFEDEDVLVVNKPAGMVTHPAVGNYSHTLVNALLNYGCPLSTINGELRPGIVHRLDKDTSGLLVIAKNDLAHRKLAQQFRRHTVKRKYIAIVKGKVAHNQGKIELPIARDRQNRQKMAVSFTETSRDALTRYNVLKRYKDTTLLELIPYTGRTHQLRVHLKFLGHPVLGDTRYGKGGISRMALHAAELGFRHPRTGEFMEFKCELPEIFS